jgi:hypothetical protein
MTCLLSSCECFQSEQHFLSIPKGATALESPMASGIGMNALSFDGRQSTHDLLASHARPRHTPGLGYRGHGVRGGHVSGVCTMTLHPGYDSRPRRQIGASVESVHDILNVMRRLTRWFAVAEANHVAIPRWHLILLRDACQRMLNEQELRNR